MSSLLLCLLSLLLPRAAAAAGPWVLSPKDTSIYLGTELQRFGTLATEEGSFSDNTQKVDSGITTMGAQAYVSYGLVPRVQLSLGVPWYYVQANRVDGPVCTTFGLNACTSTKGLGIVDLTAQVLIVDEFYGAPLSLAAGAEFRQGEHTAKTRARITNLGEGTSDVGGYLSLGRTGGLGKAGNWSGYAAFGGLYRFPNTESADGDPVPGSELNSTAEVLFGLNRIVTVGGTAAMLWRPWGVDVSGVDLADPDRFSSLRVFNLRPGVKLLVRSSDNVVFSASALGTLYAKNNPSDAVTISAGVSAYLPGRHPEQL